MRYFLFLLIWTTCSLSWLSAASPKVDSLLEVLSVTSNRDKQADIYLELAKHLLRIDPDQARQYAQESLLRAQASRDRVLSARAYNSIGLINRMQGELEAAQANHSRALLELEALNEPEELSLTYRQLGAVFHRKGKWDLAWEQYMSSLQVAEEHQLTPLKARVLSNMGSLRRMQGNLEEALELYQQALNLAEESPEPMPEIRSLVVNNVANILMQEGRYEEALAGYQECLAIRKNNMDSIGVVQVMFNVAIVFQKMKAYDSCLYYNRVAIREAKIVGLKPNVLKGYLDVAYVFLNKETYDSALYYARAAQNLYKIPPSKHDEAEMNLALGITFGYLDEADSAFAYTTLAEKQAQAIGAQHVVLRSYNTLHRLYAGTDQFEEAYLYLGREARLADSIYAGSGTTLTERQEAKQSIYEKERQIERLNLQKRIQRNWWAAGTLSLALLLLAIFMYLRVRAQRKVNGILAEKNEAIRYQNYQLTEHNADLEQFAFAVSHNMREPLRTLGSYAGLVRKRYYDQVDEDGQTFLEFISGSAHHLHNLMADLLVYVQLGKRPIQIVAVDMHALLKKVKGRLAERIQRVNGSVNWDELPTIQADPDSLFLLFQHLFQNGLTFQDKEQPQVNVIYKAGPDYHLFGVEDNGLGVPPDQRQKIFQLFQRLHVQKSETGTGIGLAICQKVVHQHQGQIWVTENPTQGSTFWVKIPQELSPFEGIEDKF